MKNLLIGILMAATFSANAQVITDTVSIGPSYINQHWYSLENGSIKTEPKNNWDFGFEISGFTASILFNHVNGTVLWSYPNGDTSSWNAIDTNGLSTWIPVFNSLEYWEAGAFNAHSNPNNDNDLGWGVYNSVNHHITGDSLYIMKAADGSYKKLWIVSLISGTYRFKISNLDGSAEMERTLSKSAYSDRNFGYYSLADDQNLDHEPSNAEWDLLFTQYAEYYPGFGQQNSTGILLNKGLEAAKAYPVDDKETFTDYEAAVFDDRINTIGREWKAINYTTFQWEIADSTVYFVFDKSGKLWKLVMRAFGGSTDGNYIFSKEEIEYVGDTTSGINEVGANAFLHVYPNPAHGEFVSFIHDLKSSESAKLIIQSINGTLIQSVDIVAQGLQVSAVSVANLPAGVYVARLETQKGHAVQKLIIE